VTFRCTRKVRDRVRLAPDLPSSTSDVVEATEWYCDLLMLGRRPAYLVTHAPSLFTVLFPAAGASSPGSLGVAVRQHVREALARAGYPPGAAGRVLDEGPDLFCKTADRGVLGSMNDFAGMASWAVQDNGSADPALLAMTADEQMNEAPMSRLGMESPRNVLRLLLEPRASA
jgi:hypothetical protein